MSVVFRLAQSFDKIGEVVFLCLCYGICVQSDCTSTFTVIQKRERESERGGCIMR